MKTYFMKSATEVEIFEALETVGLAVKHFDQSDPLNQAPEGIGENETFVPTGSFEWWWTVPLDVIGTIYAPTGETLTDAEGFEYPEMAAIEGFHANLKASLTSEQEALLPLVSAPATPYRKFAGDTL